jgi:hypothetical protein
MAPTEKDRNALAAFKKDLLDYTKKSILPCSLGISASLLAYNAGFDKLFYLHDPAIKMAVGILGILILPPLPRKEPAAFLIFSAITSIPFALVSGATMHFNTVHLYYETKDHAKPIIKELAKAGAALFTAYMMNNSRFDPILSFAASVGAATATHLAFEIN